MATKAGTVYLTDLADILRRAGLRVVEVPGWKSRGWRGGSTPGGGLLSRPRGGLVHHTATSAAAKGDYPSLGIVRDGRSDVPGPLSQLGLGRDGTWYVIAAGRANHSGRVDRLDYSNGYAIGVEAEHPGTTTTWDPAAYASYVKGCAALGIAYGITWRGHKEAATPKGRKIDPTFNMDTFRRDVAAAAKALQAPKEDDDMATAYEVWSYENAKVEGKNDTYAILRTARDEAQKARKAADAAKRDAAAARRTAEALSAKLDAILAAVKK